MRSGKSEDLKKNCLQYSRDVTKTRKQNEVGKFAIAPERTAANDVATISIFIGSTSEIFGCDGASVILRPSDRST